MISLSYRDARVKKKVRTIEIWEKQKFLVYRENQLSKTIDSFRFKNQWSTDNSTISILQLHVALKTSQYS